MVGVCVCVCGSCAGCIDKGGACGFLTRYVMLVFTDIHDQEIFALKKKHFAIHKTFHAESPKGHDLFVITKKFTG